MKNKINESCILYNRNVYTPTKGAKNLFNYLQWTGNFICKKDFYINRSSLKSLLLVQTVSGEGILHYKGEHPTLSAGSFFLIDCESEQTYFPKGENWEFRFVHFYGESCLKLYEHIIANNGGHVFTSTPKIDKLIDNCLDFYKAEETLTKEAKISQTLTNLLYEILFSIKSCNTPIDRACSYIDENYFEELSTEFLAKKFGFSRSYFSTEFKKVTGNSLHDYIVCKRLNIAKQLLISGDFTISQIAERVGFKDTGTFIRAFKRKEKLTPLQFKNKGY